jgi:hypothetical protein
VSEAAPCSGCPRLVPNQQRVGRRFGRFVLAKGSFRPLGHDARGTAVVIDADANIYARFEDFEVENGPDLKVYLSRAAPDAPEGTSWQTSSIWSRQANDLRRLVEESQ